MSVTNDFIEAAAEFVKQTLRVLLLGKVPKPEDEENQNHNKPAE
jgi:preprotein translocase subunit Sss1|tara:strand:- start:21 stop:152 length:132 start_codon:yes stop_codon:yes gene_type:complete